MIYFWIYLAAMFTTFVVVLAIDAKRKGRTVFDNIGEDDGTLLVATLSAVFWPLFWIVSAGVMLAEIIRRVGEEGTEK